MECECLLYMEFEKKRGMIMSINIAIDGPAGAGKSNFNYDIFSTRRTVVGPTIALLGFVLMIVAIMYKKKDKTPHDPSSQHEA